MAKPTPPGETRTTRVQSFAPDETRDVSDEVATEEPMEIRILVDGEATRAGPASGAPRAHSIAVTMRTPGDDIDLALGFLVSENLITRPADVVTAAPCGPETVNGRNIINVRLAPDVPFDPARFSRNVYTTSSCGICGKASIDLVRSFVPEAPTGNLTLTGDFLHGIADTLERKQRVFEKTGGLHASALFDRTGELLLLREDVGRHNALDKVVGALFAEDKLPASDTVLWVSGRAGYELVQKCLAAGIPVLAAVGAPSSLAVDTAREFGMTLIGFLRDRRFNVYSGRERVRGSSNEGDKP